MYGPQANWSSRERFENSGVSTTPYETASGSRVNFLVIGVCDDGPVAISITTARLKEWLGIPDPHISPDLDAETSRYWLAGTKTNGLESMKVEIWAKEMNRVA